MGTILISTSKFETAIPNYFKYLGEEFRDNNFSIIYVFDGQIKNIPPNKNKIKYFTYPNKRPTKLKDFIFLCKIIKKEKPFLCISNFGSTNIVTIASFIYKVPNRLNYIHTSSQQLDMDSNKNYIYNMFFRFRKILIFKMNTHFLTNSNKMSEMITSVFKIKKNKISVLPYLLEKKKKAKRNYKIRERKICIVGRLSPSKGHKDLLYSFADCKKKLSDLKLMIVGDGPEEKNLKNLTKSLDLNKDVEFLGAIPNKNIGKIFSKCLVSVSSSKSEAFGIVNIESLKEGTPIICTETEGSQDILKQGENGLTVDLTKKNDLYKKLFLILKDWEYFSNNALNTFETKYSKVNIKHHFKKFIDEILLT